MSRRDDFDRSALSRTPFDDGFGDSLRGNDETSSVSCELLLPEVSTSATHPADRAPVQRLGFARVAQVLLGILFFVFGTWVLVGFPYARPWLIGLAAILLVLQWLHARAWLVAVPMLFAVVDLGAWSGRFLFSEQDALLAVLVGAALAAGQYGGSGRELIRSSFAPLWLVVVAVAVGLANGLQPVPELDANAWNGYLTGWNAVRVAKGPIWALILWPLLACQLREDRQATEARMTLGLATALIGLGTFVLWERGLARDLVFARDIWGLFSSWLDLSDSYRITGPFSQMHLGGEAVDGFFVLTWPFAFLLLFQARRWPTLLVALLALAMAAYGVMVTFTRTTYVATAIAVLSFGAAGLAGAGTGHRSRLVWTAVYVAAASVLFLYGFRLGGTLTTIGYLFVVLGAIAAGMFVPSRTARTVVLFGLLVLIAVGASAALRGMLTSKWSQVDPQMAATVSAGSAVLLGAGGLALGMFLRPWASMRTTPALLLTLAVLLPAATLGLSGAQIDQRFSTVSRDLDSRLSHWRSVLALVPGDATTTAFGLGLGHFPLANLLAARAPTGTWHFEREGSRQTLRLLGTASLCYGQRVRGLEAGVYRVEIGVRNPSKQPANLAVKLQPRRLLEAESWQPRTKQLNFVVEAGRSAWQRVEGELQLDAASVTRWYDPRFAVLALANQGDWRSAVDVAYVRLLDSAGRDLLVNGDFENGGDHWFAYNDFRHLEWHPKNFYVAVFVDLGILGVAAFALVFLVAVIQSGRRAYGSSPFGAATMAALIGFLALGAAGTLLDVPQIMTLVLLIAVSAMWRPHRNGP